MSKKHIFLYILSVLIIIFSLLGVASQTKGAAGDNVYGYAWSSNIGWISFNSTNDHDLNTVGIQPSPIDYGVRVDNTTGNMTGYAWSSNIGWIKFGGLAGFSTDPGTESTNATLHGNNLLGWARACVVYVSGCSDTVKNINGTELGGWDGWISLSGTQPIYGVTFDNTTGALTGFAWGSDVVGWIRFQANVAVTGIEDVCLNIPDIQETIPAGYTAVGGNCNPIDLCPNLDGNQTSVPLGYTAVGGNCVPNPIDVCPNITDNQSVIPSGMVLDSFGNCKIPGDACPNISENQSSVPSGYIIDQSNGYCITPNVCQPPMYIANGQCVSCLSPNLIVNGVCTGPTYCQLYPNASQCQTYNFCQQNPNDLQCISYCQQNPTLCNQKPKPIFEEI